MEILNTRSLSPEVYEHVKRDLNSKRVPILRDSGCISKETEGRSDWTLTNLPKESHQFEKLQVIRTINDTIVTPLNYSTYHRVERSLRCSDQVRRKVMSIINAKIKALIFDGFAPFQYFDFYGHLRLRLITAEAVKAAQCGCFCISWEILQPQG